MLALTTAALSFAAPMSPLAAHRFVSPVTPLSRAAFPAKMAAGPFEGLNCGSFEQRMDTSVEVTVSKIFPAGAGWQLASVVAANCGFASTSLAFFACVGLGDMSGVFLGHVLYQFFKKTRGAEVNMDTEIQVGSLLGGAAFFSGSAWQVAANAFNRLGFTFTQSLVGVSITSTIAFFAGLRIMRRLLSGSMAAVEGITYDNQESDLGAPSPFFCMAPSLLSRSHINFFSFQRSPPPSAWAAASSSAPT